MRKPKSYSIFLIALFCAGFSQQSFGSRATRGEIELCRAEVQAYHADPEIGYRHLRARSDETWADWERRGVLDFKRKLHQWWRDSDIAAEHDLYEFMRDGKMIPDSREELMKVVALHKKGEYWWKPLPHPQGKAMLCLMQVRLSRLAASAPTPTDTQTKWSVRFIDGNERWDLVTTDNGCLAYDRSGREPKYKSITWSGNCQKGKLISGNGSLTFWLPNGGKLSFTGQFVSGFMHGRIILHLSGTSDTNLQYVMGCESSYGQSCGSTRPTAASTANPATTSRNTQPIERTSTPAAGANPSPRPSAVSRDSGSADLAPVASSPKQAPKSAAVNDCLKFKRDKDNRIELTNVCDFTVRYSWCLKSPDRSISVFACKDPYQGEGSAGLRAGGTTSLQGSTKATGVRWIACRGTIGEVLPLLSQNGKNGCY